MGCSSTIIRKSQPRSHLPPTLYKSEPVDPPALFSIPAKVESDDSEPQPRRHGESSPLSTPPSSPTVRRTRTKTRSRKVETKQRRKPSKISKQKPEVIATKELILDHIQATLPNLPGVDELDITDMTIAPSRCKKYGYGWEFANRYSFPAAIVTGHGKYKGLSSFTPEEHQALAVALRDGSLRAILDEETVGAMILDDEEAENRSELNTTMSDQEEGMSAGSNDEDDVLSDFGDPSDSDENDFEPKKQMPDPIDNPRKRKRRSSDGFQKTVQEKYREGPMARARELKEFLLNHINTTLPTLTSVKTINDVYLAPYRQDHIGYAWKFSRRYKAFPGYGKTHKALNNFTNAEGEAMKEALKEGWLTAVLKDGLEKDKALEEGTSPVSSKTPQAQRIVRRRKLDISSDSEEDDDDHHSDTQEVSVPSHCRRGREVREILLQHIHKTLPQLASSTTIKEVYLHSPHYPRAKYIWKFSNGYSFPSRTEGYGGFKAFNNWTRRNKGDLEKALSLGNLKAVMKENSAVNTRHKDHTESDEEVEEDGTPDGRADETIAPMGSAGKTQPTVEIPVKDSLALDSRAHQKEEIMSSVQKSPETTTISSPKQQPNNPQTVSQHQYTNGNKARADATKRILLAHINSTLPSLTTITSIDQIFPAPQYRGADITYAWEFSNGYEFPKYIAPERAVHMNSKAMTHWNVAEHKELKEALEKGWVRAVVRDFSVKVSKRTKVKTETSVEAMEPQAQPPKTPAVAPDPAFLPPVQAPTSPTAEEEIQRLRVELETTKQELAQQQRRTIVLCSLLIQQSPVSDQLGLNFEKAFVFKPEIGLKPIVVKGKVDKEGKSIALEVDGGEAVVFKTVGVMEADKM